MVHRIILRCYVIFGIAFYLISSLSVAFREYINNNLAGFFLIILFVLGLFYFWFYCFYHWGIHNFKSKRIKTAWFCVLLLGMFGGALIYYIIVYELGKSLQTQNS